MFLTQEQILKHQFDWEPGDSVFGVIDWLFNEGVNLIKFDYRGKAQSPMLAAKRVLTGETLCAETVGHVQHKDAIACLAVGSRKDNLNIIMTRSMHTRKTDGSYDIRCYTIASPLDGIRVPSIEVCFPFKTWETIDISTMIVWPQLESNTDLEVLGDALILRAKLAFEKDVIDKEKSRLTDMYGRHRKAGKLERVIGTHGVMEYIPPSGTTMCVVDENGERVKMVPVISRNGVRLVTDKTFSSPIDGKLPMEKLPWLCKESSRLTKEIKKLNDHIRPFELGIIEVNMAETDVFVGLEMFKLERFDIEDYDYPPETKDNLESGKWKWAEFPKSRGENKLRELTEEEAKQVKATV